MTFHSNQDLEALEGMPHLVLDTSHAAVSGHDPIEVRRLFGPRLRHVHLSDNAGKGRDSHLPPGDGVLDIDGFLEDLSALRRTRARSRWRSISGPRSGTPNGSPT